MKNMSSIEKQLDGIARRTIPPYLWIGLITLFIAIGSLLVWAIWDTISIHIEGKGIILNQQGLFSVQTPLKGVVKTLFVKVGDEIESGTLVAQVYDAQKEEQLRATHLQVEALQREVQRLTHQIEMETEASKKALKLEFDALEYAVKLLQQQLQFLEKEYKKKQQLYREELIVIGIVQDAERQIHETQVAIAEKEKTISEVQAKLAQSYRTEELKNKELELLKAEQEATVIQITLEQNKISSPYKGKVIEILVSEGEMVKEQQPLVYAEFGGSQDQLVFYAYFPGESGKYIHEGSTLKMYPSIVNPKEFGALLSRVESVSAYPVSEEAIISQIHNANLARFFTNKEPVTQVIAIPLKDPQDPSGYEWTSHQGPPIELSTGIIGIVEVVIETIHPIYYLFPNKELKKTAIQNPL